MFLFLLETFNGSHNTSITANASRDVVTGSTINICGLKSNEMTEKERERGEANKGKGVITGDNDNGHNFCKITVSISTHFVVNLNISHQRY